MSIFGKIFGDKNDIVSKSSNQDKQIPEQIKRTIFDFFQMDLHKVPDDSFVKAEMETNSAGEKVQNFRKSLDYIECGIFDTIEIKIIEETGKNIFFKSFQPESVKMDNLKKLIDSLYLIYGNDEDNKGKFTNKDVEEYNDAQFNLLFGRRWTEFPKYTYPVAIGRDDDEVSISIWSTLKD